MKKFIGFLFVLILSIAIIVSANIGIKGYKLYKITMENVVIEDVIDEVRSRENYVTIDQLPSHLLEAFVAVEDHRFMSHNGFDIVSFGRAVIRNLQESEYAAGGSTITQQLSKNLFFSFEKTFERKVAELIVAKQLEDNYSKDEILELYLNIIYYGDGFENIYDASMGYFSKLPKDLNNAEATLIAGLPQAPSSYAMIENFEKAVARAYQVVDSMVEYDYLTEGQGIQLKNEIENTKLQVK